MIVEAKQRGQLTQSHVDDVAARYAQAVTPATGRVIIVNYDGLGGCRSPVPDNVALLGGVVPDSPGEAEMLHAIACSGVARERRHEVWYVDTSYSMSAFVNAELRQQIAGRTQFAARVEVYAFALRVEPKAAVELAANVALSGDPADAAWEGHGVRVLAEHVARQLDVAPAARLFVLTDLACNAGPWRELQTQLGDSVRLLHPASADLHRVDP